MMKNLNPQSISANFTSLLITLKSLIGYEFIILLYVALGTFQLSLMPNSDAFKNLEIFYFLATVSVVSFCLCSIKAIDLAVNREVNSPVFFLDNFFIANSLIIAIQFIALSDGDYIFNEIISNQQISGPVIFGVLFTLYLLRNNVREIGNQGSKPGVMVRKSNSKIKQINNSKQIDFVAIHEVGHAIFHAGANIIPDRFQINIIGNSHSEGFVRTFADSELSLSKNKVWSMYMLLGGHCAEKVYFGDYGFGSGSDLAKWELLAKRYLAHSRKVHFYSHPKNANEINYNAKLLNKLKRLQLQKIELFINENKVLIREMADELKNKKIMDKSMSEKYFKKVDWPKNIPKLIIK